MVTVYLFHRDLRLIDSNGLEAAAKLNAPVLPIFVFTPAQVSEKNAIRSLNSIQFMIASLAELESDIRSDGGKLYFAYGETVDILRLLAKRIKIGALVETADYTPYAKQRTVALTTFCKSIGASYVGVDDSYLCAPGTILNKSGKTFQKFTPFYNAAYRKSIPHPSDKAKLSWHVLRSGGGGTRKVRMRRGFAPLSLLRKRLLPTENEELAVKGGRSEGLKLLKSLPRDYSKTRDMLSFPTSFLSAHNHFGTLSIREVYYASDDVEFRRQLWWRDFYGCIMADFDALYGVGPYEFQSSWAPQGAEKDAVFRSWCAGKTGVPLVDAGMRQMLRTGYMHNRARMACASWLVKEKGVHWRRGERFFAAHLVDYDAAQNMMNWIWIASVLPFASAPFRRVDPISTAKKYDPDGAYVRTWLD